MIINLLHTLTLATSVGIGSVAHSFENDPITKQINRANEAGTTAYTETTTPAEWETRYGTTGAIDNTYRYTQNYRSTTSTTISNPNTYLQIQQENYIKQEWITETQNSFTGKSLIAETLINDRTLKNSVNAEISNNYLEHLRSPAITYVKTELTGSGSNTITIKWNDDNSILVSPILEASYFTRIAINYLLFITTENITEISNEHGYNRIQNEQYYTGQKKTGQILLETLNHNSYAQTLEQEIEESNITLTYGKTNYLHLWIQPSAIVQNYTTYNNGNVIPKLKVIPQKIYRMDNPAQYNTWEEVETNIPTQRTTITGINRTLDGYEVIDMPGLIFVILGMPFTFISTAFNLTLFVGTPYELNFSYLFLGIFAVVVFVFIVRLIIGVVGKK